MIIATGLERIVLWVERSASLWEMRVQVSAPPWTSYVTSTQSLNLCLSCVKCSSLPGLQVYFATWLLIKEAWDRSTASPLIVYSSQTQDVYYIYRYISVPVFIWLPGTQQYRLSPCFLRSLKKDKEDGTWTVFLDPLICPIFAPVLTPPLCMVYSNKYSLTGLFKCLFYWDFAGIDVLMKNHRMGKADFFFPSFTILERNLTTFLAALLFYFMVFNDKTACF